MLKKTIVLINPTNLSPPAPNYLGPHYGLSLIGAILLRNKRPVKAYDFDLEPLSVMLYSIREIISKYRPEYMGITIQSCNRSSVYELIKTIKEINKSIVIILGGPFASVKYELLLRNFPVDYAVIGDGEETLSELLDCLDNGGDIRKVNGISFLLDNHLYVTGERTKETNLDLFPFPAFHLFKNFAHRINSVWVKERERPNFILGKRSTILKNALLLLSSRGCIYSCNFCPMSQISKNKIRFHSPQYFIRMIEYFYKKYQIKHFAFGDNTFTLMRNRVMEICEGILKKNLKIKWSCMTRADYVDSEILKKMARAGCFEISYGIESGSPKIQEMIGKNLDLTLTKEAFKKTKESGIRSVLMLMTGNLGESNETIKETLGYIKDMDPDNVLVKIVKVYPGTDIHDIFEKKNLLKRDYYLTSEFSPPSFTVEHSEKELEKFAQMINTRRTSIQIGNICNNSCVFCSLNKEDNNKDFAEVKKELILSSTRGEHIILFGGEPFLHKDFFKILAYADKLEIHHLYIQTNARVFIYKHIVQKVGTFKLVEKIIIPFFGFSDIHDGITRVKGTFGQTAAGIKNLKKYTSHLKIQANIFILNSNYRCLLKLTRFLSDLRVDEFRFIFLKDSASSVEIKANALPPMTSVMPEIKKIVMFLRGIDKYFCFEGFPLCILRDYKANTFEPYYPFNEIIIPGKGVLNCREEREKEKERFGFCLNCNENLLCEGVWRKYSSVYGNSEFNPY